MKAWNQHNQSSKDLYKYKPIYGESKKMKAWNQHNQSSKDLYKYKPEDSILDRVIATVSVIAFILIVALS